MGDRMSCCGPAGYDEFFGEKQAKRDAKRYRRKGLGRPARWIVDTVRREGIGGATLLEPGGGVGSIQLELLKAGAARSTVVELSRGYDEEAQKLAREAGLEERIERRHGDFVVCCYPDYERLLGAAADRAGRVLVYTHPPRNLVARAFFGGLNLMMRLRGSDFRGFAHPPERMEAVVRSHGLVPFARRGGFWRGAAFRRERG
jgi:magnesium-protoporphyrin O-methyltransferase